MMSCQTLCHALSYMTLKERFQTLSLLILHKCFSFPFSGLFFLCRVILDRPSRHRSCFCQHGLLQSFKWHFSIFSRLCFGQWCCHWSQHRRQCCFIEIQWQKVFLYIEISACVLFLINTSVRSRFEISLFRLWFKGGTDQVYPSN